LQWRPRRCRLITNAHRLKTLMKMSP
jgi:hypothetical protein